MPSEQVKISPQCPIRTTLELVGGKWKLLILHQLNGNTLRFGELKSRLPDISEKMLIQELKILVRNKLVVRTNHGEVPPRVDYALTEKGKNAEDLIEAMVNFAVKYKS
ncbi:MAG: helix-turn-helix domain-containing protein [Bacteroidota bacterium]